MIDRARSARHRPVGRALDGRARRGAALGERTVVGLAALFALFLALPVVVLVVRAILDGSLAIAVAARRRSSTRSALSLVTTVDQPGADGRARAAAGVRRWPGGAFRGKWLVEAIVDLPIVLPPSVAGLALLLVFGRRGAAGGADRGAGIDIPFTTIAVILAQTFVSAPFFVRSARAGIAGVDRDLEDAARVDGATERQAVPRRSRCPLAGAALAAGLVMTWARALGRVRGDDHVRRQRRGPDADAAARRLRGVPGGDLDASIAAAAILVLAAFGVLVAVRLFHWGRALDTRTVP